MVENPPVTFGSGGGAFSRRNGLLIGLVIIGRTMLDLLLDLYGKTPFVASPYQAIDMIFFVRSDTQSD